MKILFLDIDGVLNNNHTKTKCNGFDGIDPVNADLLKSWLSKHPEVIIVISSSWRTWPKMLNCLHDAGFEWKSETPYYKGFPRGDEIDTAISEFNNVTHFAILDDLHPIHFHEYQRQHLVNTAMETGLVQEDLNKLDKIMGIC